MNSVKKITLIVLSFSLIFCGDSGQLDAFKNLQTCGDRTLGDFIENNAVSYEWQNMTTKEYGDVVGFIAEFEVYGKGYNAMMGLQANYKPSSLNKGQFEYMPVGMEMGKKGEPSMIIQNRVAFATLSNFCKDYKKLNEEEKFIKLAVEPAIDIAKVIQNRVNYCSIDFGNKFNGSPIGRFPEKTSDCDDVYTPRGMSDELGIGIEYTKNKTAKAEYLDGTVQVTFLTDSLKGKTIVYKPESKQAGKVTWSCSGGTLEKMYLPADCSQ